MYETRGVFHLVWEYSIEVLRRSTFLALDSRLKDSIARLDELALCGI